MLKDLSFTSHKAISLHIHIKRSLSKLQLVLGQFTSKENRKIKGLVQSSEYLHEIANKKFALERNFTLEMSRYKSFSVALHQITT